MHMPTRHPHKIAKTIVRKAYAMNNKKTKKKLFQFITNVVLLSATSFIMRAIGVRFNVYLSERLGTDGLGLFTLTMSLYALMITFATSAVGFASTRLISEAIGKERDCLIRPAMKQSIIYSVCFGTATGLILFLFAEPIGSGILGDRRTVSSLRLLSLSLPFVSLTSALSGYFTAVRRVAKSSATQIAGQIIRIGVTVFALEVIIPGSLESSCLSVIAGGVIAEAITFFASWIIYLFDRRRYTGSGCDSRELRSKLISIAIPMAFSSYVRSALTTIEHLLIPWGLRKNGCTSGRALEIYGVMQGMALPVIMFPYAFLTPLCSMLVPEVAERRAAGRESSVRRVSERAVGFVAMFGIGIAGIMICYSSDIGNIICKSEQAGNYIRLLAPLVPIMYMDTCVDSVLKGVNEQLYSMRINMIDASLSVVIVFLLTPKIGIYGFIAEIYICEIINASLSIARLAAKVGISTGFLMRVLVPTASAATSSCISRLFFRAIGSPLIYSRVTLWLQMSFTGVIYASLCLIALFIAKPRRKLRPQRV